MFDEAKTLLAATMLVACAVVSAAGQAEAQAQPRSMQAMTIAGVRIGMAEAEATSVLKRDGWTLTSEPGPTWDEAVAKEVGRQRNVYSSARPSGAVGFWRAKKGDETVMVNLKPTPTGGTVSNLSYRAPYAGRSFADLQQQLIARYGRPATGPRPGMTGRMVWRSSPTASYIAFEPEFDGMRLDAHSGVAEDAARKAVFDRAVAARMGATASF